MLSIRQIQEDATLSAHCGLDALGQVLPIPLVAAAVARHGVREQRRRKLPAAFVVLLMIAMNLDADVGLSHVFRKLVHGLRWLWPHPMALRVSKGALCRARYRVGPAPLVDLFHQVCRPLASPTTPEAFLFDRRLMALDSSTVDLPDTPANAHAFGRPTNQHGDCSWPQARLVALSECGTHAIVDAGLWPYAADLHAAARRLLRTVTSDMLVLWDQGLHSFELIAATQARGAPFLGRLPSSAQPPVVRTLADGTQVVRIVPTSGPQRRARAILVRLIRYTFDDPRRPGHRQTHRLITSLLDPQDAPAEEVICAYHHRWEHEVAIDEIETHQRPRRPLRSEKPVGVIQEVYGLLLAHYIVRTVMVDAAQTVQLAPTRMSFRTALEVIRETLPDFQRTAPCDHGRLYQALLAEIAAVPLPPRANRINPRVVKRKTCAFPAKRPHHRHWPSPPKPFREAIVLLK